MMAKPNIDGQQCECNHDIPSQSELIPLSSAAGHVSRPPTEQALQPGSTAYQLPLLPMSGRCASAAPVIDNRDELYLSVS